MSTDYTLIFLAGLLGSAHCVGMCGGFVLALAQTQERSALLQLHQALYLLGVAGFLMRPLWRARMNLVSGLVVILLGLMTFLRGTPAIEPVMRLFGGHHHDQHELVEPAPSDSHEGY